MIDATTSRDITDAPGTSADEQLAIPLDDGPEQSSLQVSAEHKIAERVLEPSRALVPTDLAAPALSPAERLMRMAYRIGVPGHTLTTPFKKQAGKRLMATVETPLAGERMAGVALRAGHFLVYGVKAPIGQIDFGSASAKLTPPFERVVHGYSWLRDLAGCAPREQAAPVAQRIHKQWLDANPKPGKAAAWEVESVGLRLMAWLVHAPLLLTEDPLRARSLAAMEETARWLDRNVSKAQDRMGEVTGWTAIVAAGLLLSDGKPRRLFGESGLAKALGELVAEDGGVLSRSPLAQMEALALLVELTACYRARDLDPPEALATMMELLVPPLLTLMHGEAGMGSWQGAGAVSAEKVAGLIRASGVRTRPLKDVRQWGYQRARAGKTILQFDAAPPPLPRHSRSGCASTLAFELSANDQRIIVNCGGAAFGGGQVPHRIEQGLRATAAHSTMVLDDANSTAVLIKGKLGSGVNEVEIDRRQIGTGRGSATRLEASHDGYAARYGLNHRRILVLRDDGTELLGEDVLLPAGKKGKRGKIGYAIRFHIGPRIELRLAEDKKGAGLALPDGTYWQFRVAGDFAGEVAIEESLWVDGNGRPQPIQQLVIQGMTSRSGGVFSWLLKQMG
ncbi:heparinase II/III family protein [Parerythrobacter jejuensis]|uniref:Heparinase n=1 Tax=Parerythrobacter jejuensis TaxID=795812 RepID=A0A845ANM5_9SPHN|nr:heparinase II/III family protein [Parerythrobacter jejuensis]MXP31037.1 heparinase [Parerythrobacter jejuensis]MXP33797.1 heparinase [Parerythrobacter jejuensis]